MSFILLREDLPIGRHQKKLFATNKSPVSTFLKVSFFNVKFYSVMAINSLITSNGMP